jgi:hypothetical protein
MSSAAAAPVVPHAPGAAAPEAKKRNALLPRNARPPMRAGSFRSAPLTSSVRRSSNSLGPTRRPTTCLAAFDPDKGSARRQTQKRRPGPADPALCIPAPNRAMCRAECDTAWRIPAASVGGRPVPRVRTLQGDDRDAGRSRGPGRSGLPAHDARTKGEGSQGDAT